MFYFFIIIFHRKKESVEEGGIGKSVSWWIKFVSQFIGAFATILSAEFEKTKLFHSYFLENSKTFLNFAKNSNAEFLNFLSFPKILL